MHTPTPEDMTMLIDAACRGDSGASARLLPLVYEELRKLAAVRMANEPKAGAGQTLQPTALVHEAYLRLLGNGSERVEWSGRGHFFGAAALAMRRILVERARARHAVKRGGGLRRTALDVDQLADEPEGEEVLALEDALVALERADPRKHRVVMLRYFAGLSVEDTAAALELSPATVKNDWAFARAWLKRHIAEGSAGSEPE
jgi:RNA polymerase sigma factor (TIGR02999 family)